MKIRCLIFCLLLSTGYLHAQQGDSIFRMAFYNVENFFDYFDDTLTNDEDFTPRGIKGWSKKRYQHKCMQLFKVIAALNAEVPLIGVGLCEIENAWVLKDLCHGTPLRQYQLDFVHFDSPDRRGIDVAFLYSKRYLQIVEAHPIPFITKGDSLPRSRDILYVKALLMKTDTLHIFVTHFPSKFGGVLATQSKRFQAAELLRKQFEIILEKDSTAFIMAMGDFNDEPNDESLENGLRTRQPIFSSYHYTDIVNLMYPLVGKVGSHKYQAQWSLIDQFMVNGNMMKTESTLFVNHMTAQVFSPPFLLMEDENYHGKRVFRTFYGSKYLGGYSDHLPIVVEIMLKTNN